MYKASYTFHKTHPTSLSFNENEVFLELPGASGDKNWYYVVTERGTAGFVPRNYVHQVVSNTEEFVKIWEVYRDKIKHGTMGDKDKGDLLLKLDLAKRNFLSESECTPKQKVTSGMSASNTETLPMNSSAPNSLQKIQIPESSSHSSSRSSTPPKSMKKRAAPPPPTSICSTNGSPRISESPEMINSADNVDQDRSQKKSTSDRRPSGCEPSQEQIRQSSRELIELVRDQTGLSYITSQSTVIRVLNYLCENFNRLDRNVPALLEELEVPSKPSEKQEIIVSQDAQALEAIFEELTKRKEDDQQRNWMLHKDEHIISDLLQNLQNILQNAQKEVSLYAIKKFKYFYIHSLVEYFQMEARWSLRQKLIETFMLICSLDPLVISLMLSSVLPLELAQDLFQHTGNVDRLRYCALLLTVIFSRGEPMPVHYFNQLGENFIHFLLEHIENPLSREHEREISDIFIGLILSYNLQFQDKSSNVTVKCLMRRNSAKAFTEQLLLLLNREEDPTVVVTPHFDDDLFSAFYFDTSRVPTNATHKMVLDIFQDSHCHELFYTNDIYVLIDIIVRQLSDLSTEDVKRKWYATMCRLVLLRSNYSDHLHRFKDLERCFMRILEEEESTEEQKIIKEICQEIPAFVSLKEND